jgi:hypothetical protein
MTMKPYRENVIPFPLPDQPQPLFPFSPWTSENYLVNTRTFNQGILPGKSAIKPDVFCPKCSFNTLIVIPVLCIGKKLGRCRKVKCSELREHFHVKCERCQWHTLMSSYEKDETKAPKDA